MVLSFFFLSPALGPVDHRFGNGQSIYEPGDAADRVFFIRNGEVRLNQIARTGEARLVEILGPGDWFNGAALAGELTCGLRAIATEAADIISVSASKMLARLSEDGSVAQLLLKHLAGQVQRAREEAARLAFDDCNTRLIRKLLDLSRTVAATPCEGGVQLKITHQQLAQAVGAARETISLALTDLRKQNMLKTGRNRLVFNPDQLRQLSQPPSTMGSPIN